ncbi:MAG: hypothetical protein ACJAT7_001308 [Psychromonas sp.]|jgi:hypothetical protein|uniref:DUF5765 domain-containing protein n=1 Tax=Psychromonas sp. TaxID=1884585 RepID=UPI0039E569DE
MCWSGEASATLAVAGVTGAIYFYKKGEPKVLCSALLYFTLIEILQAYTYTVIDQCQNPENIWATTLSYIHVSFQPFFFNAIALHFIPADRREKIQKYVYAICTLATIALLIRVLPLDWEYYCYQMSSYIPTSYKVPFCGPETCSQTGSWHIEWAIRAGYNWYLDKAYWVSIFILPLLYGSWKVTVYCIITGPMIAILTSSSANEFVAVWCIYSAGIILLLLNQPIRKYLYVDSFYGSKLFAYGKEK